MGKYYEAGTTSTHNTCDDLNGWTKMKNGTPCNFEHEVPQYKRLLQELFPVRFQQKNEISSSSLGDDIAADIEDAVEKTFTTYYVPVMMLQNGAAANLKVLLRIDPAAALPKRIEITHTPGGGGTSPFTITNGVISKVTAGLNSKDISIACNGTFSDFQTIDAHGIYDVGGKEQKALCGQLRVHPNDVIRSVNLLHIKVELDVNSSSKTGRVLENTELSKLRRIFDNQALIECNFPELTYELRINNEIYGETYVHTETEEKTEPLSSLAVPPVQGVVNRPPVVTETPASVTTVAVTINKTIVGTDLVTTTITTTTNRERYKLTGNANPRHDWLTNGAEGYIIRDKPGFNDLVLMAFKKDLRDKAAAAPAGSPIQDVNRYDRFVKIFTFDNGQEKAAGVTSESSHVISLFTRYTDETLAHEVGHALGLLHPFTASERGNRARFTYQAKKTNNIMDYSHLDGRDRYSLFYWQMQEMWRYIDSMNATPRTMPSQLSNEEDRTITVEIPDINGQHVSGFLSIPKI